MLNRYITQFLNTYYSSWIRFDDFCGPVRRQARGLSMIAFMAVVATHVLFPRFANADMALEQVRFDEETISLIIDSMQNKTKTYGHLPVAQDAAPRREYTIPITAYTSDIFQTDDTPCVTASGLNVCERDLENVIAANFLPLGTRVKIPGLFGDRVFYVEDRMNERYFYKMDVWMKEIEKAKEFGVQYATIEVY